MPRGSFSEPLENFRHLAGELVDRLESMNCARREAVSASSGLRRIPDGVRNHGSGVPDPRRSYRKLIAHMRVQTCLGHTKAYLTKELSLFFHKRLQFDEQSVRQI